MNTFVNTVAEFNFGMSGQEQLIALLLIPTVASFLVALLGRFPNLREAATLVSSVALMIVAWPVSLATLSGIEPTLFIAEPLAGIRLQLELEPLGAVFVLVASTLWVVSSLYSIGYMRGNREQNQTRFFVCFAIAIAHDGVATPVIIHFVPVL